MTDTLTKDPRLGFRVFCRLRMCDLLEKFRVATFVWMQPECSVEGSINYSQGHRKSSLLFPVCLLEVAFRGIGLRFEEIVIFSAG
jgi:hypothetical protein